MEDSGGQVSRQASLGPPLKRVRPFSTANSPLSDLEKLEESSVVDHGLRFLCALCTLKLTAGTQQNGRIMSLKSGAPWSRLFRPCLQPQARHRFPPLSRSCPQKVPPTNLEIPPAPESRRVLFCRAKCEATRSRRYGIRKMSPVATPPADNAPRALQCVQQ